MKYKKLRKKLQAEGCKNIGLYCDAAKEIRQKLIREVEEQENIN